MKKNTLLIIYMLSFFSLFYISALSQIRVVNMVPLLQSNETGHAAEPNLAVNPANRLQIVGTAFTPDPMGGANAPIYISTDGGTTWSLNSIIPGNHPTFGTGDITARFSGSSNQLYTGILRGDGFLVLNLFRIPDFTAATVPTPLVSRGSVDQPYVQAATLLGGAGTGNDRVYAAINERSTSPLSAGIDFSLNAFSTPPPGGFTTTQIPSRPTTSRVQPGVRPTIHPLGIIYIAYYNQTATGADVVVARDDSWATGATPFRNLLDNADMLPGQRVVIGRTLPAFGVSLGNNRLVASNISVAVNPTNAANVYVAWADRVGATDYTLHVRSSTDFGQTWSADLLTITNATNPTLAVNSAGKVAFSYQELVGSGATQTWDTHIRRSTNGGSTWDNVLLSTALTNNPATAPGGVYLGDYMHLMAIDKDFFGIFSASNVPRNANFPQGVTYQRNANFGTNQLLGNDGVTTVNASIDPFFFQITELPANNDFFVRDFTNSLTVFDPGLEPSTYPWFYVNSDVWNKRSNAPGVFNANNQPQSEDPWQSTDGHNYAFARVHRKAAGSPATVNLHYLYAEFGTGSNYVNANTTPDLTLPFGAADVALTTPSGYEWDLPVTTSTHPCMAVEISTPTDPLITPSLLGRAPGWSNGTDLMVLNDNNKAQRNMHVYHVPPEMMEGASATYAAIHNPGVMTKDIIIKWAVDSKRQPKIRFSSTGNRALIKVSGDAITLNQMKPGETRFLKINTSFAGVSTEGIELKFSETKNDVVFNGFSIGYTSVPEENAFSSIIKYENAIVKRVEKIYNNEAALKLRRNNKPFLESERIKADEYLTILKTNSDNLQDIVTTLQKAANGDPFDLTTTIKALAKSIANNKAGSVFSNHLSLLNGLDVFVTSLELAKGNTADILQNVNLQNHLLVNSKQFKNSASYKSLVSAGDEFIDLYEKRKISNKEYADFILKNIDNMKVWASENSNSSELNLALENIRKKTEDIRSLQKAHLEFLLLIK